MPETGASWPTWYVVGLTALVAVIGAAAIYDIRTRRIPNAITYPAITAATAFAFFNPTGPWYGFVIGGLIGGGLLATIAIASGGGMGMGDAKLGVVVGLLAGFPGVFVALFAAFASGALVGMTLIALRRLGRKQPMPFAPALLVGTVVAIVAGPQLVSLVTGGMV